MDIIHYFKDSRWSKPQGKLHDERRQVAELARGCAREGHVTLAIMLDLEVPPICAACGSGKELLAMRVPSAGVQVCCLLCGDCRKTVSKNSRGHGKIVKELRQNSAQAVFEMAYLFKHGPRIRIVWGSDLGQEVLT